VCAALILLRGDPPGGVAHPERIEEPLLHESANGMPLTPPTTRAEQVDARG